MKIFKSASHARTHKLILHPAEERQEFITMIYLGSKERKEMKIPNLERFQRFPIERFLLPSVSSRDERREEKGEEPESEISHGRTSGFQGSFPLAVFFFRPSKRETDADRVRFSGSLQTDPNKCSLLLKQKLILGGSRRSHLFFFL